MAPYGVHEMIEEPVDLYVTLREPIDRCLSLIRFMHMHPTLNPINVRAVTYGTNISAMLADPNLICLKNEQTRMLSNSAKIELDLSNLNAAKNNLQDFAKIVEFGNIQQLNQIIKKYGSIHPPEFPTLNAAPSSLTISNNDLEALRRENSLDIALYTHILYSGKIKW